MRTHCYYLAVYLIFGAVIGSFLNVCAYRIPKGISVAKGRSFCDSCHHTLGPADLVPVFSWIFLRGRCRYCGAKIPSSLPLVEAGTALAYGLVYESFGLGLAAAVYCLIASVLIVMALIDQQTKEIPDALFVILAAGAAAAVALSYPGLISLFNGMFIMSIPLGLVYLFTKGRGIGSGDIILVLIAGSFLGAGRIILAVAGAYIAAALAIAPQLRRREVGMKTEIAMFPYLCAAIFLSLLYGNQLIGWYLSLLS